MLFRSATAAEGWTLSSRLRGQNSPSQPPLSCPESPHGGDFFLLFLHLRCKRNREWERGPAGWRGAAWAACRACGQACGLWRLPLVAGPGARWLRARGACPREMPQVSVGLRCGCKAGCGSCNLHLGPLGPELAGRPGAAIHVGPDLGKAMSGTHPGQGHQVAGEAGEGHLGALALPGKPAVWADDPLHPDRPPRLSRPRAVEDASPVFR